MEAEELRCAPLGTVAEGCTQQSVSAKMGPLLAKETRISLQGERVLLNSSSGRSQVASLTFHWRKTLISMFADARLRLSPFLVLALVLVGCKSQQPQTASPTEEEPSISQVKEKRLTRCVQVLVESMKNPQQSFHFSFKGQENLNPRFPKETSAKPDIGPVVLQADFTPGAVRLVSTRGKLKTEQKARKGEEPAWSLAQLDLLSALASTSFAMALGSSAAQTAGNGNVAGFPAEEFKFDTKTATGAEAVGVQMTRSMLTHLKDVEGSAWLATDTGRLLKFNIDADYADSHGRTWKERYEGEVAP